MLRPYDSFGRYGGEEFLLILADCESKSASIICERVRKLVCDTKMKTEAGNISVSISMGACSFPSEKDYSIEKLVQIADTSMYKAKDNGRNCVVFASN